MADKNNRGSRRYCFTINNPKKSAQEYLDMLTEYQVKYAIIGREVGSKEHTEHLQGFVNFVNKVSFNSIHTKLDNGHIETAKGSDMDNKKYCSKDNDFIEFGKPVETKSVSDLNKEFVLDIMTTELSFTDLVVKYPDLFLKSYHNASQMFSDLRNSPDYKRNIKEQYDKRTRENLKNFLEEEKENASR